jgi:pre-rRNA-processing protein TSR3
VAVQLEAGCFSLYFLTEALSNNYASASFICWLFRGQRSMFEYEIIVDHKEKTKKCTILPLRYREDFHVKRYQPKFPQEPLSADVLLHHEGTPLDQVNLPEASKIAALDSTWQRLPGILKSMKGKLPVLVSIPSGFVTAYPRKSKDGSDPSGGLATIEAIFIAAAFLGNWDESLFDEYYFGDSFLSLNKETFKKYGILPSGN